MKLCRQKCEILSRLVLQSLSLCRRNPKRAKREASPAVIPEPGKTVIDPAEKKQMPVPVPVVHQPADEIPSPVLVPQTFRLPQRLIEDLARAAIERKIKRRRPWSQQDIVAEAIKEWLRKHVSK